MGWPEPPASWSRAGFAHASVQSLLALAYLVGPGTLLALTCYVIALRRLPATTVSTYAYMNPVVAVALGSLLLGEVLTGTTMAGGTAVIASVVVLLTTAHVTRHEPATKVDRTGPAVNCAPASARSPRCPPSIEGVNHGH